MTRITAGIIGKCAVVDSDDDFAYYVSLALLRPNHSVLNSKFLKHYLESGIGRAELAKRILWNATPTKINKVDIGKLFIAVPPLDVQERIVCILDKADDMWTGLGRGLPTEIEARQKQYEYYREKLLTFTPAE
jgi:type I restriction enzyme S subunit